MRSGNGMSTYLNRATTDWRSLCRRSTKRNEAHGESKWDCKLAERENRSCLVSLLPPWRKFGNSCAASKTKDKAIPTQRQQLNVRKANAISA